jgi:hypothetical protein
MRTFGIKILIFPNGPVVAAHGGFMHGYAAIREHFTAGDPHLPGEPRQPSLCADFSR